MLETNLPQPESPIRTVHVRLDFVGLEKLPEFIVTAWVAEAPKSLREASDSPHVVVVVPLQENAPSPSRGFPNGLQCLRSTAELILQ